MVGLLLLFKNAGRIPARSVVAAFRIVNEGIIDANRVTIMTRQESNEEKRNAILELPIPIPN